MAVSTSGVNYRVVESAFVQHNTKPKSSAEPRTLGRAKEIIRELQARMGLLKTSDHVPAPTPVAPVQKTIPAPVVKLMSPPAIQLADMTPKGLLDFYANSTTQQLRECLSIETARDRKHQSPAIIASLYKELKRRRS